MSTTEVGPRTAPPPFPRLVTVELAGTVWAPGTSVIGETTLADGLVITPRISESGRLTGGWTLTHERSGKRVPTGDVDDLERLHLIAGLVSDLDWTHDDRGQYALEHQRRIKDAAALQVDR